MGFKIALAQWVVLDASCGERQGSDLLFIHPHLNNKPPQAQKQPPEIQAFLYLHVFTNILPPKGSGTGKVARMKGKSKKKYQNKTRTLHKFVHFSTFLQWVQMPDSAKDPNGKGKVGSSCHSLNCTTGFIGWPNSTGIFFFKSNIPNKLATN